MEANPRFSGQSEAFWASVRVVGEEVGYSVRGQDSIKVPSLTEIHDAYSRLNLRVGDLGTLENPTLFANELCAYFQYRAEVLNEFVKPRLMDVDAAREIFQQLRDRCQPTCPIPMNKQTGEKKTESYFTGIINMLIEESIGRAACDYDPRTLTSITANGTPIQTLSRRVDGAFPSAIDPVAIWEIKEYYFTTTFGSRVADGVYETLLDGMELQRLEQLHRRKVLHYLMVDAYFTWWVKGKSYLCRIIDMLHMGFVDEVLFGREVVERLPVVARSWLQIPR